MKRVTAIAAAAILMALVTMNLASAQDNRVQAPAKAVEKKIKIGDPKHSPDPAPSPVPTPTPYYNPSPIIMWDSGELQTQIGSKNKDKKKLVMRVWCVYGQDSATTYWWQVKYSLKAENKKLVGPDWKEVPDLYALDYHLIYKVGSGSPVTKSGSINLGGESRADGVVASGSYASAKPTFTTNQFTGKRGGGSSGINLAWP